MIEIKGTYNLAKVFTDTVEESARVQIERLLSRKFAAGCQIRIMPDVHAGAGCVIGFTADLGNMVIPNIVGFDIGCGMLTVELGKTELDFARVDAIIRSEIPSGKEVHEGRFYRFSKLQELFCYRDLKNSRRFERSIGTLGGGNHFIEVDQDEEGNCYLVIHTGSRNLGKQVAEHYQELAYDLLRGKDDILKQQEQIIKEYKATGRKKEIQSAIKALKKGFEAKEIDIPKELCYLTGEYREKYLFDMKICQEFAALNRLTIAEILLNELFGRGLETFTHFETVHNYIDHESNIVRKGAVSAKKGEKLLIPINMRDGSLICIGKGNADWNESAPHGAGRLYSRAAAKEAFSVQEFEKEMEGIFTTSVGSSTLDECPMAYKNMDDIIKNIEPTADIIQVIKPLYNFKAGE